MFQPWYTFDETCWCCSSHTILDSSSTLLSSAVRWSSVQEAIHRETCWCFSHALLGAGKQPSVPAIHCNCKETWRSSQALILHHLQSAHAQQSTVMMLGVGVYAFYCSRLKASTSFLLPQLIWLLPHIARDTRSLGTKNRVRTVSGTRNRFRSLEAGSDPEPYRSL